jgi:hypothetical protein
MTKCPNTPYDEAADILAREIDKEALLYAAKLHDTNTQYGIGNKEDYEAFVKKRNYPIESNSK